MLSRLISENLVSWHFGFTVLQILLNLNQYPNFKQWHTSTTVHQVGRKDFPLRFSVCAPLDNGWTICAMEWLSGVGKRNTGRLKKFVGKDVLDKHGKSGGKINGRGLLPVVFGVLYSHVFSRKISL